MILDSDLDLMTKPDWMDDPCLPWGSMRRAATAGLDHHWTAASSLVYRLV